MKKLLCNMATIITYSVLLSVMLSTTAYAYIDSAATSYIIQIIAGVVIAFGVTVGIFWKKIKLFFRNKRIKRLERSISKKAEKQ